jgi:hypothetical protein
MTSPSSSSTSQAVPIRSDGNLSVPDSNVSGTSPSGRNRNGLISRMKFDPPSSELGQTDTGLGMTMPIRDAPDQAMGDEDDEYDDDMSVSSDVFGSSLSDSVILEEPEEEMEEEEEDGEMNVDDDDTDEDDVASSYISSSSTSSSIPAAMRRQETPGERRERHRQEEEEEMRDQGKIPEYLRKDSAVEQYRYQHVHDLVAEGAATPKERREGLSHAGLTDRLSQLQMGGRNERSRELGGRGDGDETPRGRTSPRREHASLPAAI